MDTTVAAIDAGQRGAVTARQAQAAGFTAEEIRTMVRSGRWRRLRRGVYVDAATYEEAAADARELHLLHCAALRLALDRGLVLSHWSAARVHRLQFLNQPPVEVYATDPDEARSGPGYRISGSTLPTAQLKYDEGFILTGGARTVCDLARGLSFRQSVVIADSALRIAATTPRLLRAATLYCSHFEGIGRAARACAFADGRAESVLESVSRVDLVALGVPRPELQVEVYGADGFLGRADMLWEAFGVVGEADGKVKYTQPYDAARRDELLWAEKKRMSGLEAAGLAVVRWTSEELRRSPRDIVHRFWLAAQRPRGTPAYRLIRRPQPGAGAE